MRSLRRALPSSKHLLCATKFEFLVLVIDHDEDHGDPPCWQVVRDSGYRVKSVYDQDLESDMEPGPNSDTYKELNTLQQDV